MNKGMFSSDNHEWETPQDLFDMLDAEFHFDLDPCATPENAKCRRFYTKEKNGLAYSWHGHRVFVNPPYGREIGKWVEKAHEETKFRRALVVMLIPARTDTRWWHDYVMKADEIRFIKGRIRFVGAKSSAPFPSAIVIFGINRSFELAPKPVFGPVVKSVESLWR